MLLVFMAHLFLLEVRLLAIDKKKSYFKSPHGFIAGCCCGVV
jgi:hypothetical protein